MTTRRRPPADSISLPEVLDAIIKEEKDHLSILIQEYRRLQTKGK